MSAEEDFERWWTENGTPKENLPYKMVASSAYLAAVKATAQRDVEICYKARSENSVTELMAENIIEKAVMSGAVKQAEKLAAAIKQEHDLE